MLVRYVLDKCANAEEGVKILVKANHLATVNYIIADKEGDIAVVEASTTRVRARKPEDENNYLVCTNHFRHAEMHDM